MINLFKRALLALMLLAPLPASAGITCNLPFTLLNGQVADATQVMANYNALVTCFTNAAAAGVNSDITVLSGLTTPLSPAEGGTNMFFSTASTGSANAQVVATTTPNSFVLTTGFQVIFTAGFTNTGATTLNIHSTGALNVFRRTPSGAQALTGGELQSGAQYVVSYDGTQYELLTQSAEFGGFGPLTNLASAGTTDLGTIPSHDINITGTTGITAFGSTASTTYPLYRLTFAGILTMTHNATSLILPAGGANITTAANDTAWAFYLGGGNWQIVQYQRISGAPVTAGIDIQVFTATGANTWTRPAGVTDARVFICGAGGGGGGGGRSAAATATGGGGGGGGGYCHDVLYKAADAGASQTVTVGTGGTGGIGSASNGANGNVGNVGGNSTFGSLLTAFGGGGGGGGIAGSALGGGGGGGGPSAVGNVGNGAANGRGGSNQFGLAPVAASGAIQVACTGGSSSTGATATFMVGCQYGGAGGGGSPIETTTFVGLPGGDATQHGPGGGGGGSMGADNTNRAGATGGRSIGCPTAPAGGAAGSNAGGSTAADFNYHPGCGGGGGGSSTVTAGGNGGAGTSAGGGGGGGAGDAVNGGTGGAGGNGFAIVVSQ